MYSNNFNLCKLTFVHNLFQMSLSKNETISNVSNPPPNDIPPTQVPPTQVPMAGVNPSFVKQNVQWIMLPCSPRDFHHFRSTSLANVLMNLPRDQWDATKQRHSMLIDRVSYFLFCTYFNIPWILLFFSYPNYIESFFSAFSETSYGQNRRQAFSAEKKCRKSTFTFVTIATLRIS